MEQFDEVSGTGWASSSPEKMPTMPPATHRTCRVREQRRGTRDRAERTEKHHQAKLIQKHHKAHQNQKQNSTWRRFRMSHRFQHCLIWITSVGSFQNSSEIKMLRNQNLIVWKHFSLTACFVSMEDKIRTFLRGLVMVYNNIIKVR